MTEEQKTIVDGVIIVMEECRRLLPWFVKMFIIFFGVISIGLVIERIFPQLYSIIGIILIGWTGVFCLYVMWRSGLFETG